MSKFKISLLSLTALLVFSSNVRAEEDDPLGSLVKSFKIDGQIIQLRNAYPGGYYGISCPMLYTFTNKQGKRLVENFGTCAESYESLKQVGNKIIITMNGYKYADFGDLESMSKKQRKAVEKEIDNELKKVYQYTYQNGKVTEKRIK